MASTLISLNWLTFIYAVNVERTLEASLGYFLNPIFVVLLGRFVLKEKLNIYQIACLLLAATALCYQIYITGALSWISLTLAISFGMYGLVKKQVKAKAWDSMFFETLIAAPIASFYLLYSYHIGELASAEVEQSTFFYLSLAGAVTATPLVFFAYGAQRLPLSTLGFMQYIAPSLQMCVAIFVLGEALSSERFYSFLMIWLGLLVLILGNINNSRKARLHRRLAREGGLAH